MYNSESAAAGQPQAGVSAQSGGRANPSGHSGADGPSKSAVAGVAHDLNNLLTVIRGRVEVLLSDEHLSPHITESLRRVVGATERATGLVRQLSSLTRNEQPTNALPQKSNSTPATESQPLPEPKRSDR